MPKYWHTTTGQSIVADTPEEATRKLLDGEKAYYLAIRDKWKRLQATNPKKLAAEMVNMDRTEVPDGNHISPPVELRGDDY